MANLLAYMREHPGFSAEDVIGWLAEDPETLQVIGARFGISRERVRQIETRLKRRLKEFIEASAPDVEGSGPS